MWGRVDELENDKEQFSKEIKYYEKQLNEKSGNDHIKLHSFVVSQTKYDAVKKENKVNSVADFNEVNLFFPEDQDGYIDLMIRKVLNADNEFVYD